MTNGADHTEATRAVFADAFARINDLVHGAVARSDEATLTFRPDPSANTVAWLVWHLTRIEDDHVADAAGTGQVWTSDGWADQLALPFDRGDTGFGHGPDQVAAVVVSGDALAGYHDAVHEATLRYVEGLDADELARIVDTRWDPPVSVAVRLVSVLGDCFQHVGQAAYVRGLAERSRS